MQSSVDQLIFQEVNWSFWSSEELHLHNKTVVAKADGVVENAGEGGTGEVAEGERGGEQAGYQALHLVMCQAFFNFKW